MTDFLRQGSEFRRFSDNKDKFVYIGTGSTGGKGAGLVNIKSFLEENYPENQYKGIEINIPPMTIILADIFDLFIRLNNLDFRQISKKSDQQIALIFQKAEFPVSAVGDLRALSEEKKVPLAIRSSSMMEDSLEKPLAGVFATKMIPNNNPDPDIRFRELLNAIKFIYSSTWFKAARDSFAAGNVNIAEEKMAVIIQEIHGQGKGDYFYPSFSGVGRSYNFYPFGSVSAEEGIVDLAIGLGKTIVDGGKRWFYCPASPKVPPPSSLKNLLNAGQTKFWALNLRPPEKSSPLEETEFLKLLPSSHYEKDGLMRYFCSTYSADSERLEMGICGGGFRLIDFSPVLKAGIFPFNELVSDLISKCKLKIKQDVEIEFAVNYDPENDVQPSLAFLQIRPMKINRQRRINWKKTNLSKSIVYSENTLGNGEITDIGDIVYIPPGKFIHSESAEMAGEIEKINSGFFHTGRSYVLMGFGRWGSADPSLGIPVNWSQISAAGVIIESTLPLMNPELSQGTHFFHNLINLGIFYFTVDELKKSDNGSIDYNWLSEQDIAYAGKFFNHIKCRNNIKIAVDGRLHRGIIFHD